MNKGYFNVDNYDSAKHWHIGYYNDGNDIEAIAFHRLDDGTWDVFFNAFKSESECEKLFRGSLPYKDKYFGVFLFNSKKEEVDTKFNQWVLNELLPIRETV